MTRNAAPKPPPTATYVWRAGGDQIGHCHEYRRGMAFRPQGLRTLCGLPIVDIRLAWPSVARCPDCLVKAGVKAVPT